MKGKIKHITIALGICLLLAMIVLGLKNRNTIYTWFLGDVQTLYMQADSLYRQKRYEEAATLYSKLAKIDTAKRCQFILGDIYYQGKTGVRNYKKAMKLFLESADNGNADSQNNLGYMYAYGIGTDIDYSNPTSTFPSQNFPVIQHLQFLHIYCGYYKFSNSTELG